MQHLCKDRDYFNISISYGLICNRVTKLGTKIPIYSIFLLTITNKHWNLTIYPTFGLFYNKGETYSKPYTFDKNHKTNN